MNIFQYNGGAVVAMKGKDCVAIGADTRYGAQNQLISTDKKKIYQIGERLFVGLAGLVTDAQTVSEKLQFRKNLYELRENRQISPFVCTRVLSNLLYERRFAPYFVEPIVAGIDSITKKPYIANMDVIGMLCEPRDFVVAGTCAKQLYGMCEIAWSPDLSPDDLFETISQALVNAIDRDALSGVGVVIYTIEYDQIRMKKLKTRMD